MYNEIKLSMKLCELNITSEKNTITAINSLAVSFMCIYRNRGLSTEMLRE